MKGRGLFAVVCMLPLGAHAKEPQLKSVFPMGAAPGDTVQVSVLGDNLERARAVWFDCASIRGEVLKSGTTEATLTIHIAAGADTGFHVMRVITPGGITGGIGFRIGAERSVNGEIAPPGTLPVSVNGRLREPGEVDRYTISGTRGQRIKLEVITGNGLFDSYPGPFNAPTLAVHRTEASWLDPNAHARLVCENETRFFEYPRLSLTQHRLPRLNCEFPADGSYLVEVGALDGGGGPHFSYQVRMTPAGAAAAWTSRVLAHPGAPDFRELSFSRRLEAARGERLQARGVPAAAGTQASPVSEKEPNDTLDLPQAVRVPVLVEGAIGRPGDVDLFRLEAAKSQTLVFEIETPDTPPPYFCPRLTIFNAAGQELAENIYRKIDGDGDDWVKSLEPKTVYTFSDSGAYLVRVRDLTYRNGGDRYRYRLLVREAVPHVGRATVRRLDMGFLDRTLDRLNLVPREVMRLPVIAELEEGLDAEIAVNLENLPRGVNVLPADTKPLKGIYMIDGEVYEGRWEGQANVHREQFRPKRRLINVLLTVADDAQPSEHPAEVRVAVTASVNGRVVRRLVTQQLLLMIVPGAEK